MLLDCDKFYIFSSYKVALTQPELCSDGVHKNYLYLTVFAIFKIYLIVFIS
jgi:hypothetical protein